jgi:ABC-type glycerol-3-phosphate transport system substrate-binding protein
MRNVCRRQAIAGSVGVAAALARPHIANAAAVTAVVWQIQGFVPEEDAAFHKTVADYEKLSGNKIDSSIMPFQALNQKAIAAIHSGEVPDRIFHDAPTTAPRCPRSSAPAATSSPRVPGISPLPRNS